MTLRPLLAYLPWQLRDMAVRGLAPLAIMLVVAGIPTFAFLRGQDIVDLVNNARQAEFVVQVYQSVATLAITLGAFLFMSSSVAMDRDKQHVRFFFAQQVSPVNFYLQRFAVGMLVFVAIFALAPLAVDVFLTDVHVWGSLAAYAISLVLVGGLTVLAASLTNRDGLALILSFLTIRTLQQLAAQDLLASWLKPIARGLPPIETMAQLSRALVEGNTVQGTDVIHVVGYGIGLLVAGLLVMRRAPLVR
jgi:hypothetical protein